MFDAFMLLLNLIGTIVWEGISFYWRISGLKTNIISQAFHISAISAAILMFIVNRVYNALNSVNKY